MRQPSVIELHIEELVLHGFAPSDRHRIGDAVQAELTRRLSEPAAQPHHAQNQMIERLDGGAFTVASGARAETIGAQVAQAVFNALDGMVKP